MPAPAPAPSPSTLEGTLERFVYTNEESAWCVVRLAVPGDREPVTAVGKLVGVSPGESLRLTGTWVRDRKYGRQFRVESFTTIQPATEAGIEKYLGSGLVPGIGKGMAGRLVAHFGAETLRVIEEEPERLAEVPGIGPKRSAEIRKAFVEQREVKEVMLFLQTHGVTTSHAVRIWKAYGPEASELVRENPFRLARDIHGIGFATADKIAARLGLPATSRERAEAGVLYLLRQAADQEGHLFLPRGHLLSQARELLEVEGEEVVGAAVGSLAAAGEVMLEAPQRGGKSAEAVYLPPLHAAEKGLAARLSTLARHPGRPLSIDVERALTWFEEREGIGLAPGQREAIRRAVASQVLVITGGPGTGKTTLVRGIVEILRRKGRRIRLAAPTGRAAKRLAEATGTEARTVHRLLEFSPRSGGFERGPDRPIPADLVIVDEASMLDVPLAYSVVRAMPDGGQLILVGDVDQLPSVGPGNVLGDLIDSGALAVVRLTEIFRQARESAIVLGAHAVNRGEVPHMPPGEGSDLFFIQRPDPEEALETIAYLVAERIPESFGLDPMADVQVLSPMNRGTLGVESLNRRLRELLNPGGREVARGARALRLGDRVMQVRNNYELEVFNGDVGRLTGIDLEERTVQVAFEGREVDYGFGDLDELVPAYACSIHKSQGSEYPCVVVPVHTQHYVMLQRNLIYTALTRARRLAVLVGERRALAIAVGNDRTQKRFTRLAGLLRGGGGG